MESSTWLPVRNYTKLGNGSMLLIDRRKWIHLHQLVCRTNMGCLHIYAVHSEIIHILIWLSFRMHNSLLIQNQHESNMEVPSVHKWPRITTKHNILPAKINPNINKATKINFKFYSESLNSRFARNAISRRCLFLCQYLSCARLRFDAVFSQIP